jgi:ribose transport system permease protein
MNTAGRSIQQGQGQTPFTFIVVVAAVLVASISILISGTVVGRRYIAVGANPLAAQSSGVKVLRYQIGAYVVAAACYVIAGVLLAGFVGYASSTAGSDNLLPSIAAVVVGGTPFTGSRGSVVASGVLALGAGPAQQLLVQAVAIVAATSISACSVQTVTFETEAPNEREIVKGQPI